MLVLTLPHCLTLRLFFEVDPAGSSPWRGSGGNQEHGHWVGEVSTQLMPRSCEWGGITWFQGVKNKIPDFDLTSHLQGCPLGTSGLFSPWLKLVDHSEPGSPIPIAHHGFKNFYASMIKLLLKIFTCEEDSVPDQTADSTVRWGVWVRWKGKTIFMFLLRVIIRL